MRKLIILFIVGTISNTLSAQSGVAGFIHQASTANWGEIYSGTFVQGMIGAIPGIMGAANAGADVPTFSLSECSPDFNESSNTRMSNQCEPESACQDCFTDARDKMNFFRKQLARLNCIYQNTKNFTNSAVAFGDGASGIHAMTAIAWRRERVKIMASMTQLKQTYDTRYLEFIQGLKSALMEFDNCENKFGQGDWYQKSGFIYYEMMKERYKRTD